MRFTAPVAISLVVWSLLIQHFPPPPVPPTNGDEYSFLVIRRDDGQPFFLGPKGKLTADYIWDYDRWVGFIQRGANKKVRDWLGLNNVIRGIEEGAIIPTSEQEWQYLIEQTALRRPNKLERVCELALESGIFTDNDGICPQTVPKVGIASLNRKNVK